MPREFSDPYVYPGTDVLQNKPGLRDKAALRAFEYEATAVRLAQLHGKPIAGSFDLPHLRAIHKHIFQDVYSWAGETRTVNILKGGTRFTQAAFIEREGQRMATALAVDDHLRGLDKHEFVARLSGHYAAINQVHPFREGNGRATREFIGQLARGAGYHLDQTKIDNDKGAFNDAARQSGFGDLAPVAVFFSDAIRHSRAVAFEKLPEAEAVAQHPELAGAFSSVRALDKLLAERFPNDGAARADYGVKARAEVLKRLDAGHLLHLPNDRPQVREPTPQYGASGLSR